jgi:hypothetical protein
MPLLEENGFDGDVIRLRGAAVVVHKTRDLQEVQGTQMTFLATVNNLPNIMRVGG